MYTHGIEKLQFSPSRLPIDVHGYAEKFITIKDPTDRIKYLWSIIPNIKKVESGFKCFNWFVKEHAYMIETGHPSSKPL